MARSSTPPAEITIEGAKIARRNFTGNETMYNAAGRRNFLLLLDPKDAEKLNGMGWNIKQFKIREDDEEGKEPQSFVKVNVSFDKGRPPHIVMLTSRGRNIINEEQVELLDYVDVETLDLIVREYKYEGRQGDSGGISVYLKSMYVKIHEDALELKYGTALDDDIKHEPDTF